MIYSDMIVQNNSNVIQEFSFGDIILKIKKAIYNLIEKVENIIKKAKDSKLKDFLLNALGKLKKLFKGCDTAKTVQDVNNIANETNKVKSDIEDNIEKFKPETVKADKSDKDKEIFTPTADDIIDKEDLEQMFKSANDGWEKTYDTMKDAWDNLQDSKEEFAKNHEERWSEIQAAMERLNQKLKDSEESSNNNRDKLKDINKTLDEL